LLLLTYPSIGELFKLLSLDPVLCPFVAEISKHLREYYPTELRESLVTKKLQGASLNLAFR